MTVREQLFLTGHTVGLRVPCDDDVLAGRWHAWYNDRAITEFNGHGIFPVTQDQELEYVRSLRGRRDAMHFAIIEVATGRLVGNAALQQIDQINRHCRIALTIGEQAGISSGVEAYGLLLEHAFCRLNLNRVADATHVQLRTFVRMLSVLGFEEEGVGREHFCRDGRFWDSVNFGVLARRFFELREARGGHILFSDLATLMAAIVAAARRM